MPDINPLLIPIAGIVFGCLAIMVVAVAIAIAIVRREQIRQDTRLRELNYEQRLRELQLQLQQVRAGLSGSGQAPAKT
ncbi:MAG: hypothetical protein ACE5HL_05975 [Terriglobia bacterium]